MNKIDRGWAYMDNCPRWLWQFLQMDGNAGYFSCCFLDPNSGVAAVSRIGEYLGSWQPGYASIKVENRL